MTSVQNRLLPLSGNKWLLFTVIGLWLAACSPRLSPVVNAPVKPRIDTVISKREVAVNLKPPSPPPIPVISLLLPFNLDEIDLSKGTSRANLVKADLAMEFYQGFKLALDSLAANNNNFKLQVFDTKDATAKIHNLALTANIRTSAVIIGPVYPEQIKSFTAALTLKKMVVSPLSPASPADYKDPNLVTVIPPLKYHCWLAAGYIQGKLKAKKVFILKSGYSDDNKYILPFKKAIDSLGKKRIKVVELTVMHGNLSPLLPQLSETDKNVFIVPSTNQQFLQVTLRSLDMLLKQYPVTVFGHPDWERFTYLKPELLQHLNTYITSADQVDYHSAAAIRFLKDYRNAYHAEPGEYAIKGYDEGMYFGQLILPGQNIANFGNYEGLHNTIHLVNMQGQGYVNTHVQLYQYINFELKLVE